MKEITITCKLTSPQLQKYKTKVIAGLKNDILERKELKKRHSYKFKAIDNVIDELAEFVKTERACCSFFSFTLSISAYKNEVWLKITGPQGSKEFINTELGM